jgi:hypothetical protein
MIKKFPYWDKMNGTNHLFIFTWDHASAIFGNALEEGLLNEDHQEILDRLLPIYNARHVSTLGLKEDFRSLYFNLSKDIIIPPFRDFHEAKMIRKLSEDEPNHSKFN